jgi:general secretion pathway protein D
MTKTIRYGLIALVFLALASCTTGSQIHKEGMVASESGNYEQSIASLEAAVKSDPGNMTYRVDLKRIREQAIQALIADADGARAAGDLDAAEQYYLRVLTIEERNGRALRGLEGLKDDRAHAAATEQARENLDKGNVEQAKAHLRAVLAEDPGFRPAKQLMDKINASAPLVSAAPALRTLNDAPVTLQFRDANTQMVFEVLSRQTGINFIFDKDVKRDGKTTIFVQRVPIEQAIDLVLGQNQLGRQILSDNMVLIYPNTPAKQLEYQDQIVKTFYLTNADPKQFAEMLKTMLNAKTLFVDPRSNSVVIRDTPEIVRMAENLLESIDVSESEVMMEVEVLEVTRSKLQQLGIQYPNGATLNPTPLAGDPLVIADLRDQDSTTITITPVPVTVDLRKEVGVSNLLASPRIRARNHEKAKILIGQRVPVITNSVTPTVGGNGVVTGSVQYVDVGLTLEVEPTVHLDDTVSIKVSLEVSNIIREIFNSTSGTLAYQIGTRNADTLLQLKDGETQILAGLIQDVDRETSNRIPGLGDMPLIGRLFGSKKNDAEKTEIILSITPRIIRSQPRPSSETTEFWYGTESSLRSSPLATTSAASAAMAPTQRSGSGLIAGTNRSNNETDTTADTEANDDAPPPDRLTLSWEGPGQVAVGQDFSVSLLLDSPTPLASLRSQLRYDQAALELVSAEVGDFVPTSIRSSISPDVQERGGRAGMTIDSMGDSPVSGSGSLLVLKFKALSPRPATMISVQQFAANGEDGLMVPAMAPRPFVTVVTP